MTALALQYVSSAHSIVYLGLLPLATALSLPFGFFQSLVVYLLWDLQLFQGGESTLTGDFHMLVGSRYAEDTALSHHFGIVDWLKAVLQNCYSNSLD